MNNKMVEARKADLENAEEAFQPLGTAAVRLPAGLTEKDLVNLTPGQIDQLVRVLGPVVGYASLFKLASGGADVPRNVQEKAAEFLVERAEKLEEAAKDGGATSKKKLGEFTDEELAAAIEDLRKKVMGKEPEPAVGHGGH